MEIPRSQYDATTDVLDLPCFKFRGHLAQSGKSFGEDAVTAFLKVPARAFAQAILGLAASFTFEKRRHDVIDVPETIFDVRPTPTAFTIPSAGKVTINYGMYLSIRTMPYTISWLQSIYENTSSMSFDEIEGLAIPPQLLQELENVLRWWLRFHLTGAVNIGRVLETSMTSGEAGIADRTINQIFHFITFHEFAHWSSQITPPKERQKVLSKMKSYMAAWPSEDIFVDTATKQRIVEFWRKSGMFDRWVEEMDADSQAVQYCLSYFPDYFDEPIRRARQQVFASQALVYSLLIQLCEVFNDSVLKRPSSWDTHPPSGLRTIIFCHVGGKIRGKSQQEFAGSDWGVGTFITLIMDRVIEALRFNIRSSLIWP
jgi:hypothetical protein